MIQNAMELIDDQRDIAKGAYDLRIVAKMGMMAKATYNKSQDQYINSHSQDQYLNSHSQNQYLNSHSQEPSPPYYDASYLPKNRQHIRLDLEPYRLDLLEMIKYPERYNYDHVVRLLKQIYTVLCSHQMHNTQVYELIMNELCNPSGILTPQGRTDVLIGIRDMLREYL
jgi:hypothetical protein